MTSSTNDGSRGVPPPPITELTMEQEFQLKRIEGLLEDAEREDIITVFLALQKQNFILSNSLMNLVESWPKEPHAMFGILI